MRHDRLWLAIAIAVVFCVYSPQIVAPLELQDDHRIIAPLIKPVPPGVSGAVRSWIDELRRDVDSVGRFRPVNQVFDVIGPRVLGPEAVVWHALLVALAVAVAALLYQAAFRIWALPPAAAGFALIVMLAPDPGPTSSWYRLGPKEAWGMLFLGGAFVAMSRRRDGLAFFFVALSAYSKESFLLIVPALFGVRWWLDTRDSGRKPLAALWELRAMAVAFSVLFVAGLGAVFVAVRNAGSESYGGRSMTVSTVEVMHVLVRDAARAPMLAAGFVPGLLALWAARKKWTAIGTYALSAAVFVAWVAPQYLLYATRGGLWDHYWLPCVVAFAAVNAAGLAFLAGRSRALYRVALAVVAIWAINAIRIDVLAVVNFNEKARVQQAAVGLAAAHVTPDADLVVVADDRFQSELAFSFADFVEARGGRFRRAVTYDPRCTAGPCEVRDLRTGAHVPARDVRAGVTVHLSEEDARPGAAPGFAMHRVNGERVYLSLRQAKWVRIPFGFSVETREK